MISLDRLSETISDISHILDSLILLRQIQSTGDCNVCACQKECEYVPKPGQMVRYNCPFYKAEKEEIYCNYTDAEISKSFIKDVEAVKDLLPKEEVDNISEQYADSIF